jgi:hypothetical protein
MNELPEGLSSDWTFIYKFIFPAFWIGGFGIGAISLWFSGWNLIPMGDWFWILYAWHVGAVFIYLTWARFKFVCIDEKYLHVSNARRKCQIPLAQISKVTEWRWNHTHPVTVHFAQPTEFGNSIVFMPKVRILGLWFSNPVVAKIREAARCSAPGCLDRRLAGDRTDGM